MTHSQLRLVLVLGVPLLALPACAPKRHVTVEEIGKLGKLSEVMDAQATYADPMFKKRDQAAFTDAEYAELTDASARLQATSLKIKDFSKGAGSGGRLGGVYGLMSAARIGTPGVTVMGCFFEGAATTGATSASTSTSARPEAGERLIGTCCGTPCTSPSSR